MPQFNNHLVLAVGLIVILLIVGWSLFKTMFFVDNDLESSRVQLANAVQDANERATAVLEDRLPDEVRNDIIFRSTSLKNFLACHNRNDQADIDIKMKAVEEFRDFLDGVYADMLEGNFRFF